jgi:hypothetical protein
VLYEALTGVFPHSTQHYAPVKDVLEAVKNEQPRRPRLFRKEISPDLEAVILKALEKDPKDRYVDAEAFASDLDRALAGKRVSAHRFSPLDRMRYGLRRYRQGISAVLVLVLLGGGAWAFFRHKLLHARYVALLRQAQLKSLEYLLSQPDTGTPVSQAPPAWHEIRIARRAMVAGDWRSAADGFRKAVEISRGASDNRTAAIALLEQARCVVLLNDREQARKLYREIIANPDASPSIASFARLEYLGLARLDRAPVDGQMKLPPDFPAEVSVREAINCLVGEMPADRLEAVVAGMPRRFQNDALLAAAIRSNVEGKPAQYQALLRRCIQNSTPAGEWPGPFARQLYMNLPD